MSQPTSVAVLLETLEELPELRDVVFRGWQETDVWSSGAGSFVTTALTSTSRDPRVASENFTTTGLYAVVSRTGRSIEAFSQRREDREVVLLPGTVLVWHKRVRVGDVRVTVVEQVLLDQSHAQPTWTEEGLDRLIAARVLAAQQRDDVPVAQPGRFVGAFE